MRTVVDFIMFAVGVVFGLIAGVLIRVPEALNDPSALLPEQPPNACLELAEAGEELVDISGDYLALVQRTYLPLIAESYEMGFADGANRGPSGETSTDPVVEKMTAADQQLAELSDRAAKATEKYTESQLVCRAQAPQ